MAALQGGELGTQNLSSNHSWATQKLKNFGWLEVSGFSYYRDPRHLMLEKPAACPCRLRAKFGEPPAYHPATLLGRRTKNMLWTPHPSTCYRMPSWVLSTPGSKKSSGSRPWQHAHQSPANRSAWRPHNWKKCLLSGLSCKMHGPENTYCTQSQTCNTI